MTKHKDTKKESVEAAVEAVEEVVEQVAEQEAEAISAEEESEESANLSLQVAEWQDKYMRLSAEFDNYRKRTLREKMSLIESASEDVIKSILPVIDDMQRAEEANSKSEDITAIKEGVSLIYKKLYGILGQKGLTEIEAVGLPLDTDVHEAIARFPVEEEEKKGRIIDVGEKGYKLKDKVIRFSKVIVGE
ncbi:MAG: nucleotide exchange factor GrpE [Rikenellaceae bacterium]